MDGYSLDPNMLVNALSQKDGADSGFGGNGLLWIFLLILFLGGGFGNGGFGGNGGSNALVNDAALSGQIEAALAKSQASTLSDATILTAINGNENSIKELASTFGFQTEAVRTGIKELSSGLCELGYKMGQDTASIISQVSSGNAALSKQLADCCCATQRAIDGVNYNMATGFGNLQNNMDKSFCQLERSVDAKIDAQSMEMRAGFQGMRDYMTAEKIEQLQLDLQAAQLTLQNNAQTQALKDYVASYFGCPPGVITCPGTTTK